MTARNTLLTLALLAWLPATASAQTSYGYRVLESKPQSRQHFVQGLQIVDGDLYLSTGGYGESRLLRYRLEDGALDTARQLHPRLFGEGLAVVEDRIYQLTWRAGLMIVWDRNNLQPLETLRIATQGWGITWNGEQLIYSDGSERLHFMDRATGRVTRSLRVTDGGVAVPRLNELEWIDGKVWANVWQSDEIVIIDPESGNVTARLDLTGLLPDSERTAGTDVLNGIAQNPADGAIWVTGKRWPHMYRIELVPRDEPGPT
ncbi:glutaminyl-peptide cyclotransferase [Parahaliea mediterranea]|uniref:Glutaminyl-peptide cyclotransferase n=1 Tax=Parahaliea mediterranea TaxID=651086 RepID=A0A939DEP6_9GAMM|nr:glutaminyl-peptide cyclotransferase [Parahaliea mediterranea]MBN7796689.1 glutaminyl-peptide cyclotransferase [Parahaliea mediterranea]